MKDKKFLIWLRDRLIHVYGENENVDFIHKLNRIIDKYPEQAEI